MDTRHRITHPTLVGYFVADVTSAHQAITAYRSSKVATDAEFRRSSTQLGDTKTELRQTSREAGRWAARAAPTEIAGYLVGGAGVMMGASAAGPAPVATTAGVAVAGSIVALAGAAVATFGRFGGFVAHRNWVVEKASRAVRDAEKLAAADSEALSEATAKQLVDFVAASRAVDTVVQNFSYVDPTFVRAVSEGAPDKVATDIVFGSACLILDTAGVLKMKPTQRAFMVGAVLGSQRQAGIGAGSGLAAVITDREFAVSLRHLRAVDGEPAASASATTPSALSTTPSMRALRVLPGPELMGGFGGPSHGL